MKAVVKIGSGRIGVEIRDLPYPDPKPGWVTIAVKACGICGSDVIHYLSEWPTEVERQRLGHEFSGDVVEVGEGVENFGEGDRVMCMPKLSCGKCYYCRTGKPSLCGGMADILSGGMAEYITVPESSLLKLPEGISYEEGALAEPFAVSLFAVYDVSSLSPGQTVMIIGPGPIGLATLIAAKLATPAMILITGTEEDVTPRLELAKKLGADITINVSEEDPLKRVMELTENLGVDIVYETAGAGLLGQGLGMLKAGGEFIAIGHPIKDRLIKFDAADYLTFQRTRKKIIGDVIYDMKTYYCVLQLFKYRKIDLKPLVTHRVSLADALKGFRLAMKKEAVKVMVIP